MHWGLFLFPTPDKYDHTLESGIDLYRLKIKISLLGTRRGSRAGRNILAKSKLLDMQGRNFHKIYKDPTCIANMPRLEPRNNSEHATGKTTSIMVVSGGRSLDSTFDCIWYMVFTPSG